jgi:hypothetical protein
VLAGRDPVLARFELWVADYLDALVVAEHEHLIRRYVTWEVLRPMRARSAQRHLLEVAEQDVDDDGDAHKALESYGARGAAEAARAGLALALALGDGVLDSTRSAEWTRARAHLEFLQRHGYVLSDAERQELDDATADNTDDEPQE